MERAVIQSSRSGLLCNHDGAHHHFPGAPARPPCRVAVFR